DAERVRAEQRGAQVTTVVAEDDVVLGGDAARHVLSADVARQRATETGDEAGRDVEALAVDGTGRQPERVVLDVREVVRREHALAGQVPPALARIAPEEAILERVFDIHAVAVLPAQPEPDAPGVGARVAG